jgi:hypothetical protein
MKALPVSQILQITDRPECAEAFNIFFSLVFYFTFLGIFFGLVFWIFSQSKRA